MEITIGTLTSLLVVVTGICWKQAIDIAGLKSTENRLNKDSNTLEIENSQLKNEIDNLKGIIESNSKSTTNLSIGKYGKRN